MSTRQSWANNEPDDDDLAEDLEDAEERAWRQARAELLARPWPTDYAFEPELVGDPPRPVPAELRYGPYAHERRLISWFLLVFGMLSMGVSLLPVMKV